MMNGRASSGDDPFSDLSAASPDTQPRHPQLKRKIGLSQLGRLFICLLVCITFFAILKV
jgi:hypothetical protein